MHRSHKMQASWSTAIASEESSIPRETVRFANRGCVIPAAFAKVSSSQSPDLSCRAQGDGWSAIKSSSKVFRAFKTFSEFVTTLMPGSTGRTHEAVSTRAPVSTTQSRQTPTGVSFCKWQSVGIGVPFVRAASNTLVPTATRTGRPSIVISTSSGNRVIVLNVLLCVLCDLCVKNHLSLQVPLSPLRDAGAPPSFCERGVFLLASSAVNLKVESPLAALLPPAPHS